MDEGLVSRHRVRLHLETAGWSHQNHAELLAAVCGERTRQSRSLWMGVILQLKDISRDRKNIGNIF